MNKKAMLPLALVLIGVLMTQVGCVGSVEDYDLTGHWRCNFTTGAGTTETRMYFLQTGTSLNANGVTGTIDGSDVTLQSPGGVATGKMRDKDYASGTGDIGGEPVTWEITREVLSFGSLQLSGLANLNTNRGLGTAGSQGIVCYLDQDLELALWLGTPGLGTFSVPAQTAASLDPLSQDGGLDIHESATSGTVTIDEYQQDVRIRGSVNLVFPSGALTGSFDVPCTTYSLY
jgi:hypothetical protein